MVSVSCFLVLMIEKIYALFAGLVLGAACLFSGAVGWAEDDGDDFDYPSSLADEGDSNDADAVAETKKEAEAESFLGLLSGNEVLCARLLFEWANAVHIVFAHFSLDDLSDAMVNRLLQAFNVSFEGAFQHMLAVLKASHEDVNQSPGDEYSEAIIACLFQYLERLLEEMQRTALNAQETAREYLARPTPPSFSTYQERIAHFNANPNERSVNRHPFFLFMHEGYWLMRGWANQYPALFEQRHRLFHVANAGVTLKWIQENQYYASGMARGQLKELLDAIVRVVKELNFYGCPHGGYDAGTLGSLIKALTAVFESLVLQESAAENESQAVRLGLQAAILAEFLQTAESLLPEGIDTLAEEGDLRFWDDARDAALAHVRERFNPDEDGLGSQNEDEDSINLAEYLRQLTEVEATQEPSVRFSPVERPRAGGWNRQLRVGRTQAGDHRVAFAEDIAALESLLEPSEEETGANVDIIPGFESEDDDDVTETQRRVIIVNPQPSPIPSAPAPHVRGGLLRTLDPDAFRASGGFSGGCL